MNDNPSASKMVAVAQCPSTRMLTVEEHWDCRDGDQGVRIRLKGKWLQASGFAPGVRVSVTVEAPGRLVIELPKTVAEVCAARERFEETCRRLGL